MIRMRFPWISMLVLAAAGAILMVLLVVFERVGAGREPIGVATYIGVSVFMVGAGALGATMRPSLFFIAGRQVGVLSGALAAVALVLLSVSTWQGGFVPSSLVNPGGWMMLPAAAALLAGGLWLAPMLRRSGAFTIVDFLSFRFRSPIPTAIALIASLLVAASLALCGAKLATGTLAATLRLDRTPAIAMTIVPAAMVVIGGWRSLMLALVVAGACGFVALLAPIAVTAIRFGSLGELLSSASDMTRLIESRLALWGLSEGAVKSASLAGQIGSIDFTADFLKMLGIGLGCLALFSLTGVFTAGRAAIKSSLAASLMLLAIPLASALTAGGAVLAINASVVGSPADSLPMSIRLGALDDSVQICGASPAMPQLAAICASRAGPAAPNAGYTIRPADVTVKPSLTTRSAAAAVGLPLAFSFLYQAAPFLIGLSTLMIGAFSLAALLGHSLFYRAAQPKAVTSSRLAAVRLLAIATLAFAADKAENELFSLSLAFTAALAMAAAAVLPMLLLARLPRAGGVTASLTALGGLIVATIVLYAQQNPAAAAVYGFVGALFMASAGLASAPPSVEEQAFAAALASRADDALILDRGA